MDLQALFREYEYPLRWAEPVAAVLFAFAYLYFRVRSH